MTRVRNHQATGVFLPSRRLTDKLCPAQGHKQAQALPLSLNPSALLPKLSLPGAHVCKPHDGVP